MQDATRPPKPAPPHASKRSPTPAGYEPSGLFALRSPLLPARALRELWGEPGERPSDRAELGRALERERAATVARLREACAAPEVREAIFVASPSLAGALAGWQALAPEAARKVDQSAYRYFARMSGRSTPFGLFAGCSAGDVGERTAIELAPRASYRRHVRPDMHALCAIVEALVSDGEVRGVLRYVRNPSLYPAGGRLRYSQLSLAGEETFPLVDVEPTEHLALALGAASEPASFGELAAALRATYPAVSVKEANGFVGALIDNGLLVPALVPTVTGPEPTGPFLDELARAPALVACHAAVASAHVALGRAAAAPLGAATAHYGEAVEALRATGVTIDAQKAYQVDLVKPLARGTLGRGPVIDEMLRAASLLRARSRPRPPAVLTRLMTRFLLRYEDREVSLVEALDDDVGVGFEEGAEDATPLLDGVLLRRGGGEAVALGDLGDGDGGGERGGAGERAEPRGAAPDTALRDKLHRALRRGDREIELTAEDFGPAPTSPGPDAFVLFATLAARSGEAADAGEFELWSPSVIAPSGAAMLGRFCHADPELARRLREHLALEDERAGDALLADVVHLSSGRLGNILLRPVLRPYEIVCNGRSGAEVARQLPASDLLVSARGGRFVVRSRRLGRRILPRITNAHNVPRDATANVYRFLSALQADGSAGSWDWGSLSDSDRLPRVRSGRTVFSAASWTLGRERLRPFLATSGASQFSALQGLREELSMPRWVALAQHDNVLPLDLENPLCVETFAHLIKSQGRARLTEFDPHPGGLTAGPEGAFTHELLVPFIRTATAKAASRAGAAAKPTAGQTSSAAAATPTAGDEAFEAVMAPGSSVLYAKFYGGPSCFDALVGEIVAPLAREAQAAGSVQRWFFVRYHDGEHHLRVRFFGERARLWAEVLPALHDAARPLLASGRLFRFQVDSYAREVERYGGPDGLLLAERLFHADSEACADLMEHVDDEDLRWRAVALGVDALLADFGLDLGARAEFARRSAENMAREYQADEGEGRRSLDAKVRELAGAAEALLRGDDGGLPGEVREALERRSIANAPLVEALRAGRARGAIAGDENAQLWSYAHMHANRLFSTSPRAQELVLYGLLARAYRATLARAASRPPALLRAGLLRDSGVPMRLPRESRARRLPVPTDRLELGTRGLRVSPFCLGLVAEPGIIVEAFDAGINFFFVTADMHWPLYENVRRGLSLLLARGGGVRDDVVVASAAYVTQPEFCSAPFDEVLAFVPGLDRIDVLVAGGAYAHDFLPRHRVYRGHLEQGRFGARAIGATLHGRELAPTVGQGLVDFAAVRYNVAHRGAEEDVFPDVGPDFPALLFAFKTTFGSLSAERLEGLGLDPDHWRPHLTDYYRYALTSPSLDGLLCSFARPSHVRELVAAMGRGPLREEERQYLVDLVDLADGSAVLTTPGGEADPR